MIYPESFERKVGFDAVRADISRLCDSAPGRRAAGELLKFSSSAAEVKRRLLTVDEMRRALSADSSFPVINIMDMRPVMARMAVAGAFLSTDELMQLGHVLEVCTAVAAFFRAGRDNPEGVPYPMLDAIASTLTTLPEIASTITRTIDRFGQVRDNASPQLAEIRRSIASTNASLGSIMRRVMSKAIEAGYLEPDTSAVMRDGRFVIPVAPMHKRRIPGIVHDESASGKTFFIEPAEMVEANNRVRELALEEQREVSRILKEITETIRPHAAEIEANDAILAHLDFIHAKARYADEVDAHLPNISDYPEIEWYHAEHPVLRQSLINHGKSIVPLDIILSAKQRILVISGPNAGGKSVCLKTVGIIQYMAQCGLLPPVYENSHLGIFRDIFIDIGDDQSIEDDLSTYSSHLRNMKFFLAHGSKSTLLLIDEFGGGTEPQIGGAIAQAILRDFNNREMWGVITTHYHNLKTFAEETPGLVNGSMAYDRRLMQPLFKLSIGSPGSSFALEIAAKTGLPQTIIDDAREIVGSDYVRLDRYLLDIARDRRYWENKRDAVKLKEKKIDRLIEQYENDASQLSAQRRAILSEARTEAERIISESNASVERTIREIRNAQAEKERTKEIRRRLAADREKLHTDNEQLADRNEPDLLSRARNNSRARNKKAAPKPSHPQPAEELRPGDNVRLEGQSTVGTVLEINGKNAVVSFGMLKTTVALDRLKHTIAKPDSGVRPGATLSAAVSAESRERQLNFKRDIDVRGMRVDEALQAVTYFIDDAIQFNAGRVRILHGTGTGALRQALRQYLLSVPQVRDARDEHVQFGGAGITVVDLA